MVKFSQYIMARYEDILDVLRIGYLGADGSALMNLYFCPWLRRQVMQNFPYPTSASVYDQGNISNLSQAQVLFACSLKGFLSYENV